MLFWVTHYCEPILKNFGGLQLVLNVEEYNIISFGKGKKPLERALSIVSVS